MSDQHQGGQRGPAGRGGYKGGQRRQASGKPAHAGSGARSSGGFDKKGGARKADAPRSFEGARASSRSGKTYDARRQGERREGGAREGSSYKKFDGRGGNAKQGGRPNAGKRQDFSRDRGAGVRKDGGRPRRAFDGGMQDDRRGSGAPGAGPRASARFGSDGKKSFEGRERSFDRRDGQRRDDRAPQRRDGRGQRPSGRGKGFQAAKLSPARAAACAIGRAVRERDAFVSEVTPGIIARFEGISPEDAAFATKIARGVTATVGTLDEFIDRNLKSPDDIQDDVRDAMRVSAYELLFLGKDAYAVVDQGVELVRSVAPKASALANSVLRKMSVSAKRFPYGNPELSLQVLARSQAFPLWLAKRLMNEMGLKKATEFMRACNADAPVFIAVNAIKADEAAVVETFDQAGSLMEKSATVPGCYLVKDARVLRKPEVRALFENGSVCVSDESAQAIAALACPDHDIEAFLEIGAGRGTKTILLQSDAVRAFGRTMPMVSVDDHAFKSELLAKRAAAYGIQSVRPVTADARTLSTVLPAESFDAVLVDAPCSGAGTMRRHPEIRWRLTPEQIVDMAAVEYELLCEAAKMVKQGGTLTYATCTVFPEENDRVVEKFLGSEIGSDFVAEQTLSTMLTAAGADAHYAVRFRRA